MTITRGLGNRAGGIVVGGLGAQIGAGAAVTAAITGTIFGATEADVVAGGKTIVITLTNDTWLAGGAFDAQRQAIINGLNSAQAEATGWNAVVRDAESVSAVVRSSDTVVTITLSAAPTYDITAQETITVTVPASALVTSASAVVGTPTFGVTTVAPAVVPSAQPGGGVLGRQPLYRPFLRHLPQVAVHAEVIAPSALVAGLGSAHEPLPVTTSVVALAEVTPARVSGHGVGYREEDDVPMLMEAA